MKPKVILILNKKVSEVSDSCPTATVDIEENSKNKEYRELLLDAMVEEKKFKKGFSGEQKDMLSAYKTTNQEKRYPYLPLSSMQGLSRS